MGEIFEMARLGAGGAGPVEGALRMEGMGRRRGQEGCVTGYDRRKWLGLG